MAVFAGDRRPPVPRARGMDPQLDNGRRWQFRKKFAAMGIGVEDTDSEAFFGHSPRINVWEMLFVNASMLSKCQPMTPRQRSRCKQKYGRVRDIVFLHSFIDPTLRYGRFVFKAPANWWWWDVYDHFRIALCRTDSDPNLLNNRGQPSAK
jgi:hypothetical protein